MASWESDFQPHPLLRNGHLMTIAAAWWRRTFALPEAEERLFSVDAESKILGHCHWQKDKRRDAPVIALVHGLEGSSDSNYMRGIAEKAWAAGFHVVRLNQRNCGGTELLTPTLYNSGMSGDYGAVLEELATGDGFERIFLRAIRWVGTSSRRWRVNLERVRRGNCAEFARFVRRWILPRARMNWSGGTTIFIKGDLCAGC